MNFNILFPSLFHLAAVKIVIAQWSLSDIKALIIDVCDSFDFDIETWQTIESKIAAKVPNLPIPEYLRAKVEGYIKPIGIQLLRWINNQSLFFDVKTFMEEHFDIIQWTPYGTIDQRKTIDILIRDESIKSCFRKSQYLIARYKLACCYCLEEHISSLWSRIDHTQFALENVCLGVLADAEIIKFWTFNLIGRSEILHDSLPHIHTYYEYIFYITALSGNKVATEYFWKNLPFTERERILIITVKDLTHEGFYDNHCSKEPRENHTDTLCFLLNQMKEDQQIQVLRARFRHVLASLLEWPWQNKALEVLELAPYIPHTQIFPVTEIIRKFAKGYRDYDYQNLFKIFWERYPKYIGKRPFVVLNSNNGYSGFLKDLLKLEDKENLKLIFRSLSIEEKETCLKGIPGKKACDYLNESGNIDLIRFFIKMCIPHKDLLIRLKEFYAKQVNNSTESKGFFTQLDYYIEGRYKHKVDRRKR